jgi:nucleotide sugar dehydrogenase
MPGKDYVNSIKNIWRTYSGIDDISAYKAEDFLSKIVNVQDYPLRKLKKPTASELAKILENSYRAMNIAFIHEWTKFAEDIGVDLFEIVDSIRVRKGTHDNIMYPGFGVGGYCLTKDPLLAQWASKELFSRSDDLSFSVKAIDVNDLMPLHTFNVLLREMNNNIQDRKIAILGASYRRDVDDTRNSPSTLLYDKIKEEGGIPCLHDPYAVKMIDRDDIVIHKDLESVIESADVIVFAVDHADYKNIDVEMINKHSKEGSLIVDAFNILTREKTDQMRKKGFLVYGIGKGKL